MSRIPEPRQVLHDVSSFHTLRLAMHTSDLLVALSVQAMYLCVLLPQMLQAAVEGVCDLEVVVGASSAVFRVVERRLHLVDCGDDLLGLVDHLLLLGIY